MKSKCTYTTYIYIFILENWHTVFLMYAVDRHRLINRGKTICNWPLTVNKNISKDDNQWHNVCLFTVLTYHRSLWYTYTSVRSKGIICMYINSVGQFAFFSLKAYRSKKNFSLKKIRKKRMECMFEADGQTRLNKKIDKRCSDRSMTWQTLFLDIDHQWQVHGTIIIVIIIIIIIIISTAHDRHGTSRTWMKRKTDRPIKQ